MTAAIDMSRRDARRVALAAQGFTDPRPRGRVDRRHFRRVLDRLATVQLDSVNVVTRSHELVFFSRLGPYDRDALSRWLWGSREVFEYWGHEASLHPVERHRLLRWRMAGEHAWGGVRRVARDNPELVTAALAEVAERGPVVIGDLDVHRSSPRTESWWGWGEGKRVVEHLFHTGQVTAVRRNGFSRAYLLPERWIPAEVLAAPTPDEADARRQLLLIAARAHGIGTARDLADYYRLNVPAAAPLLAELAADGALVPVRVEGWRQPAYLHPEAHVPAPPAADAGAAVAVRLTDLGAPADRAPLGLRLPHRDLHAGPQARSRLLRAAVPARRGAGGPGGSQGRPPSWGCSG